MTQFVFVCEGCCRHLMSADLAEQPEMYEKIFSNSRYRIQDKKINFSV